MHKKQAFKVKYNQIYKILSWNLKTKISYHHLSLTVLCMCSSFLTYFSSLSYVSACRESFIILGLSSYLLFKGKEITESRQVNVQAENRWVGISSCIDL